MKRNYKGLFLLNSLSLSDDLSEKPELMKDKHTQSVIHSQNQENHNLKRIPLI